MDEFDDVSDDVPGETAVLMAHESGESLMSAVYDAESGRYVHYDMPPLLEGFDGTGQIAGVIDSGVLSAHPDIAPRLDKAIDLTGEGPEDANGHGTMVTLLLIGHTPGVRLVSIKALDASGRGTPTMLRRAFAEVAKYPEIRIVNLSAGVYRPSCTGNCTVCKAARKLSEAGVMICAAAGNLPGITACPAKADCVFSVTAVDPDTMKLQDTASPPGPLGFAQPSPRPSVSWIDPS